MAISLNDNIYINAGKPAEAKYLTTTNTKYASLSAVNSAISLSVRHEGLTVLLADGKEYWYSGGVADINLVVKSLASTSGSSGNYLPLTGGTMQGNININNNIITSLSGANININDSQLFNNNATETLNWQYNYLSAVDGNVSVHWEDRRLFGSDNNFSIDWDDRILFDEDGVEVLNYRTQDLLSPDGNAAMNWEYRQLYGSDNHFSIDWEVKQLYIFDVVNNNVAVIDYGNQLLNNNAGLTSIDWQNKILYDNSNAPTFDWKNRINYNSTNVEVINWELQTLYDFNGSLSVNWSGRGLLNNVNEVTIDWGLSRLQSNGFVVMEWSMTQLYDTTGLESLNWGERYLKNSTGDVVADWSGDILLLNGDPVNPLEAATKQYVDNATGGGSGFLAIDGSNSPTNDISWNSQRVLNASEFSTITVGGGYKTTITPDIIRMQNTVQYSQMFANGLVLNGDNTGNYVTEYTYMAVTFTEPTFNYTANFPSNKTGAQTIAYLSDINSSVSLTFTGAQNTLSTYGYYYANSSTSLTLTLQDATTSLDFEIFVKNINTGLLTINTTSSQTIDGLTSRTLSSKYSFIRLKSDGSNWIIIG